MPDSSSEKYCLILECFALLEEVAPACVAKFMANNIFENYVQSE